MRFSGTWDALALEDSPNLQQKDPVVYAVKKRALDREKMEEQQRLTWRRNRRILQHQNLARRKAERETVENYTQTPYRAKVGLKHGIDVMSGRFGELDMKMERAKEVKADDVLGRFAEFMRRNMLRVSDMISHVDSSCDGVVDLEELKEAVKMVHLDLTDTEVEILFDFLDESGDGTIDAAELESAMRDHRRGHYERKSLLKYIKGNILSRQEPSMRSEKVIDGRLLSPSTLKRQINSIPQLGQHLIHKQWELDEGVGLPTSFGPSLTRGNSFISSMGSVLNPPMIPPDSAVKQQANAALHKANIADRALEQNYASTLIKRRSELRQVVSRRKARRELLQSRSGQRAEDDMQKAEEFYKDVWGEIEICVMSATNIQMADANGSDGICKLHFGDRPVRETSVAWCTLNPIWNETFKYTLKDPTDLTGKIKVELYDQDPADQEFLGETSVLVSQLVPNRLVDIATDLEKASTGSMRLSVVFTPKETLIERKAEWFRNEKKKLAAKA